VRARALATLLLLAGCAARETDTALVVSIETDLRYPRIDQIVVDVVTGTTVERTYPVSATTQFPIKVAVVPEGRPDFGVQITASARLGDQVVATSMAALTFTADAVRTATLSLGPSSGPDGGAAGDGPPPSTDGPPPRPDAGPRPDGPPPGQWTRVTAPEVAAAGDVSLNGVYAVRSDDVWAVGWLGIKGVAFHWDGKSWAATPVPAGTLSLYEVWGLPGGDAWAVGLGGTIVRRTGGEWRAVASGSMANLSGVWGSAADDVWAVGNMGTVLRWNGSAWAPAATGVDGGVALVQIAGTGRNQMWTVGGQGSVFRYDGARWQRQNHGLTTNPLLGVWASSPGDVWVVGDRASLHFDGARWESAIGTPQSARGVWGSGPADVWAVGDSPGGQTLAHFDGDAWTAVKAPGTDTLQAVHGVSNTDGWAVGPKGVLLRLGR
jgi:hypothetical protein